MFRHHYSETVVFTEKRIRRVCKKNTDRTDFHGKIYPCLSVKSMFEKKRIRVQ